MTPTTRLLPVSRPTPRSKSCGLAEYTARRAHVVNLIKLGAETSDEHGMSRTYSPDGVLIHQTWFSFLADMAHEIAGTPRHGGGCMPALLGALRPWNIRRVHRAIQARVMRQAPQHIDRLNARWIGRPEEKEHFLGRLENEYRKRTASKTRDPYATPRPACDDLRRVPRQRSHRSAASRPPAAAGDSPGPSSGEPDPLADTTQGRQAASKGARNHA